MSEYMNAFCSQMRFSFNKRTQSDKPSNQCLLKCISFHHNSLQILHITSFISLENICFLIYFTLDHGS